MAEKNIKRIHCVVFLIVCGAALLAAGCASSRSRTLDDYASGQGSKTQQQTRYAEGEFDFSAAFMNVEGQDVQALKSAWKEHGGAVPESRAIDEINRTITGEVGTPARKAVLVALFMSDYDLANLKKQSVQGWAVSPVPEKIVELDEKDDVLRTLMPNKNPWTRYFLLKYSYDTWNSASSLVISKRNSKVEFPK